MPVRGELQVIGRYTRPPCESGLRSAGPELNFAERLPMSGNTYGKLFTVTTAGESHGPALVAIVDG